MQKPIAIGAQDFGYLMENHCFYIDKTQFIKEWWEGQDIVTLITRPRRFGKTITMSMLDYFFSNQYTDSAKLFQNLAIWKYEKYRQIQGTYPVIFLSFAGIKENTYEKTRVKINQVLSDTYSRLYWIREQEFLSPNDKEFFDKVKDEMSESVASVALQRLCGWLYQYYGKKCIILLDEYDTPMQEAYINGYWKEMTALIRTLFNNTFKTNSFLERAIMTGITRVSKESIFSDLNNLNVVTTTSDEYASYFGFTEDEVFAAMDEQRLPEEDKAEVKKWYDGFTFGNVTDIYNPWSIISYLDKGKIDTYWANTSGNGLAARLIRQGDRDIKTQFENLMKGGVLTAPIDEQIIFDQLDTNRNAIWSLLLASGYLKVLHRQSYQEVRRLGRPSYTLTLTNLEVRTMFESLIMDWFEKDSSFGDFVTAMFMGDVRSMNRYMNQVAMNSFSYFDAGSKPSADAPERFYHGFVLGLLVENAVDYIITSNRESGFGRYDVVLEPRDRSKIAVVMEFKVYDKEDDEADLSDTADHALQQIEDKKYAVDLLYRGIPEQNILKYGLAFMGQKCQIKKG